jgi:hypothetical protein
MNRPRFRQALRIATFAILFVGLAGFAVKTLWNALLPDITGVSTITFWQALGLLVLSRILFGGFGRGPAGWKNYGQSGFDGRDVKARWRRKMAERWQKMTPEQRAQAKQHWCNRWPNGDRRGNNQPDDAE